MRIRFRKLDANRSRGGGTQWRVEGGCTAPHTELTQNIPKAGQELHRDLADEWQSKSPELVQFDSFVEVHTQQGKGNAQVVAEIEAAMNRDDVRDTLWVTVAELNEE